MISRMMEIEEENRCLRKMYLGEKLKAEIVAVSDFNHCSEIRVHFNAI